MFFPNRQKWISRANFHTVFNNDAGAGNDDGTGNTGAGTGGDGGNSGRTYTEAEYKAALQTERTRLEQEKRKLAQELTTFKTSQQHSEETKTALEAQIRKLEQEFLSKEELQQRAQKQKELETELKLTELQKRAETYENKFKDNLKRAAITGAASRANAANPDLLYKVIADDLIVEPIVGADGKPTEDYTVKVKYKKKDPNGDKELVLNPDDAFKLLVEDPYYAIMFNGEKRGGVGGRGGAATEPLDFKSMTPEQYRKNRDKLGLS